MPAPGRPPKDFVPLNNFQRWAAERMLKQGIDKVSDVATLAGMRTDTVWKVLRGAGGRLPEAETAVAIGRALGDVDGALEAAFGIADKRFSSTKTVAPISDSATFVEDTTRDAGKSVGLAVLGASTLSYGVELDPAPYLYALSNVRPVAAGTDLTRTPLVDAPGEDLTHQWPVRAIRIVGTCMEPLLKDGEIALVLPPEAAEDGCVVTATVDLQHPVCKRVRITEAASWLEPHNGEGIISEERFVITGVVEHKIASMRPPRVKE